MVIWPIASTILVIIAADQESNISQLIDYNWTDVIGTGIIFNTFTILILWFLLMPVFWTSGRLGSFAWDDYNYTKRFIKRQKMKKSTRQNLKALLKNISEEIKTI